MTSGSPEELRDLVLGEGGQRFAPAAAHQREALAALHDLADEVTVDALARERVDDDGRVAGGARTRRAPSAGAGPRWAARAGAAARAGGWSTACVSGGSRPTSAWTGASAPARRCACSAATAGAMVAAAGSSRAGRRHRGSAWR